MQKTLSFSKTVLAAVISTAISQMAMAQATDDKKAQQLELIEVVGSGSENPLKSKTVSGNQDLVRYSTDMGVPETGRFGSQGFNIRGVENNRVAIMVDGVSQAASNNYATFSRYSYYNKGRPEIDTELMSDVDIQKGASAVAGNGALGGAVNYQTKTVDDILMTGRKLGGMLKYTYNGRNREHIGTAGVAAEGKNADALFVFSQRRGNELQTTSQGPDIKGPGRGLPNPYKNNQYSYLGKIGLKINDEHRFEFKALKQRSKDDGQELSYSAMTLRDFYDVKDIESYGISYLYAPKNGIFESVKLAVTQQDTEISGINDQIRASTGTKTDNTKRAFYTDNLESTLSATFRTLNLGGTQHQFNAQVGYALSDFKFETETYTSGITPTDKKMQAPVETKTVHILLGDAIQLTKNLSANLNARYEKAKLDSQDNRIADKTFNSWSGDVGVTYQFTPEWQLGYKFSRGFRTPIATEIFFNRTVSGGPGGGMVQRFLANTHLKPETSLSNEISLVGNGKLGRLAINAYHTNYKNLIDMVTLAPNTYQSQNIHKATIKGLDIQGTLNLNSAWNTIPTGFELNGGLGYAKGTRADGSDLLTVQPLKALFGLGYRAADNDWAVHLNATYTQGKKTGDAKQYAILPSTGYLAYSTTLSTYPYLSNSATVFDLVAHKKFGERAVLKAGVYNLFNKKYWTWDSLRTIGVSSPGVATGVTGEGLNRYLAAERYAMISLEFKF